MDARSRLRKYLKAKRLTQEEFGALVGVTGTQVNFWLCNRRRPGLDNAFAIEKATKGKVPADAWLEAA